MQHLDDRVELGMPVWRQVGLLADRTDTGHSYLSYSPDRRPALR
jgi:hypothetical protein